MYSGLLNFAISHIWSFGLVHCSVKGKKNLTAAVFCHWINEVLLLNSVLEPGDPRRVSLTTALRWMHNLGFQVIKRKVLMLMDMKGLMLLTTDKNS